MREVIIDRSDSQVHLFNGPSSIDLKGVKETEEIQIVGRLKGGHPSAARKASSALVI